MKRWFAFLAVLLILGLEFSTNAICEAANPNGAAADASGYSIPEVPMIVHISEDDMNIFTRDTPADSQSLARSSLQKEQVDMYTQMTGASLVITHKDEEKLGFFIEVRLKDDKYAGLPSWTESSDAFIGDMVQLMFSESLTDYSIYRTDSGVFAALSLTIDANGFRYVTIQNGDIIYVHAKRDDAPMTDADFALLKTVVDSIEFV